jgi:uncharacterized protein
VIFQQSPNRRIPNFGYNKFLMKTITTPPAFHIMTKPRGAICNLDCQYCYFLSKERLYPDSAFRMDEDVLENFTRQYIEAQRVPEVTFAWQGGEPTLMGLDFFEKAVEFQEKYTKPGMKISNALQTNGTTLDDDWGKFFKAHDFLIGLSIDGPQQLHDAYRHDKGGKPTFDRVMTGLEILQKHKVDVNALTTVHATNAPHPQDVYRFLRDVAKFQFIQFIPIVERDNATGYQEGSKVTKRSVKARQYGDFLIGVFDEWVRRDVGQIYVQMFDVALGAWLGQPGALCVFAPTCGTALAMEHNGDLFACDHFVEPKHILGNIQETDLLQMVSSEQQIKFGQDKLEKLSNYCLECEVRFACHGGCPKNRFIRTPKGEQGLNYLCQGYKRFFKHIDEPLKMMAFLLRQGQAPADVMNILARQK